MKSKRMCELMAVVAAKLCEAEMALEPIGAEEIGPTGMDAAALEAMGEAFANAVLVRGILERIVNGCMGEFPAGLPAAEAAIGRGFDKAKAGRAQPIGQA